MESLGKRINNANNLCRPGRSPGAWSRGGVWEWEWAEEGWGWGVCFQPHLVHVVPREGQDHPKGMLSLPAAVLSPLALARSTVRPGSWWLQTEPDKYGTHYSASHSHSQPHSGTRALLFSSLLFLFIIFLAFWPHPLRTGLPGRMEAFFSSFAVPTSTPRVDNSRSWPKPLELPTEMKSPGSTLFSCLASLERAGCEPQGPLL